MQLATGSTGKMKGMFLRNVLTVLPWICPGAILETPVYAPGVPTAGGNKT